MKRVETFIRTTELGLALASTYMTAVTLLQTSLYGKLRPILLSLLHHIGPILRRVHFDQSIFDFSLLALAILLSILFWRRGDEAGFGRLFTLNMLMFFPAVIDFSMFNWVNLILPYDLALRFSPIWVLGVGVLLQITYISLRQTVRFRGLREELIDRGAKVEDVDDVSKNQMAYLALLMAGTSVILISMYYATLVVKGLLRFEAIGLPYPHVVIGVACTILIALATIIYLRGHETQPEVERKEEIQASESDREREDQG